MASRGPFSPQKLASSSEPLNLSEELGRSSSLEELEDVAEGEKSVQEQLENPGTWELRVLVQMQQEHYDTLNETLQEERETSRLVFLRKFNNFIKSVLINDYAFKRSHNR